MRRGKPRLRSRTARVPADVWSGDNHPIDGCVAPCVARRREPSPQARASDKSTERRPKRAAASGGRASPSLEHFRGFGLVATPALPPHGSAPFGAVQPFQGPAQARRTRAAPEPRRGSSMASGRRWPAARGRRPRSPARFRAALELTVVRRATGGRLAAGPRRPLPNPWGGPRFEEGRVRRPCSATSTTGATSDSAGRPVNRQPRSSVTTAAGRRSRPRPTGTAGARRRAPSRPAR
jgi:hypothetical protein